MLPAILINTLLQQGGAPADKIIRSSARRAGPTLAEANGLGPTPPYKPGLKGQPNRIPRLKNLARFAPRKQPWQRCEWNRAREL